MDRLPPDFDWVSARRECSAVKVFEMLYLEAKKNVETFNATVPNNRWEIARGDGIFTVVRREFGAERGVRFLLAQDEIRVEGQGVEVAFTATLTLNDDGDCRLKIGKEALDRWQVLRRALEPLLFASRGASG